MTKTETLTGEQQESRRRRKFWMMMTAFMVGGGITGAASGVFTSGNGAAVSPALAIGFVAIFFTAFVLLSWHFFTTVDELELADNLWASLFGLYFYLAAVPTAWFFNQAGIMPPIDQWPIYFGTAGVTFGAYLIRKLLNR